MTKEQLWEWALAKGYQPNNDEIIFEKPIEVKGKKDTYKVRSIRKKDNEYIIYSTKAKPKFYGRLAN